ncbi:MAG: cytochrome C [Gallionella sp.]|nr:cytochrome C [Gallionella sp.]
MHTPPSFPRLGWLMRFAGLIFAIGLGLASPVIAAKLDNQTCLSCHDGKKMHEVENADGDKRKLTPVMPAKFAKGVHAKLDCVSCHTYITDDKAPHKKESTDKLPSCSACHTDLWEKAKAEGKSAEKPRLGVVVENIAGYEQSFHARPNGDEPDRPNATCHQCHNTHEFNVPPRGSPERAEWHLTTPKVCGESCHTDQLEEFAGSVHGKAVLEKGDAKAAVCVDCHTSHEIGATAASKVRLAITEKCGSCHENSLKTYRSTYHGQVGALGHAYTAKCFDCHGSHDVRKLDDPDSLMNPEYRLETCQKCHTDKKPGMRTATAGFVTFGPHAHGGDFEKYPEMWIATKGMVALLIGVFAFFWLHSGLWYYREWQDRKAGKAPPHIDTKGLVLDEKKHFRRFHVGWRVAHLVFALITMTLVLTGTSALFAHSSWAPIVSDILGGPKTMGLIHRVAAALFVGIFLVHFVYVMQKLLRSKTFRWFGPDSLIPNWKDLADCWGMFKWFLGKGPRPRFDRWAYFEKFDYWAVFWGVNVIGWSGLMLAFPHVTASYLPGWVFNVATLVHGEEAFLAAVFLFTVHFFNNHFRPDKLPPPDIVMFTGTQSLEEFRHDHPAQYQRLVDSGELEQYLVDAPSTGFALGSKILGLILIGIGLVLLALVINGFLGSF